MKMRYANHSELELAPDGAKMTLHWNCVCITPLLESFRWPAFYDNAAASRGGIPYRDVIS